MVVGIGKIQVGPVVENEFDGCIGDSWEGVLKKLPRLAEVCFDVTHRRHREGGYPFYETNLCMRLMPLEDFGALRALCMTTWSRHDFKLDQKLDILVMHMVMFC